MADQLVKNTYGETSEELIQELNTLETNYLKLLEGVNQLTNPDFIRTRGLLRQTYAEMNPAKPEPETLYYPASGADICFPFLLFPTLKTVYAFALEEFGDIFDINKDRIEGCLPKQWHITGEPSRSFMYSREDRGSAFCDPDGSNAAGWDDKAYYSFCRDNRICADLLFRIRHILGGKILTVKKRNYFCNIIEFEHAGSVKQFVYCQFSDANKNIFADFLMSLLPINIDILFLKGAQQLLQEDQTFLSLCVNPFKRQHGTLFNPMVVGSPQSTSSFGKINHKEQQRYIFTNLEDILTVETSLTEEAGFAFGYNDCMYIGSCKQLRTNVFCPILAGFTYYIASAGTLLSVTKESKLPLSRPHRPLAGSHPL